MLSLFSPPSGVASKSQQNGPVSLEEPSSLQNASWRQRFHRSLTHLILFSFFFQTLWPSVVFAADGGVEVLRPPSPLAFRIHSLKNSDVPKLSLEVWDSDDDEADELPASPRPLPLFQKTFEPTDVMSALAPVLASSALLGQLQVKTDGIEWFAQGLLMTINWQGELLVRGDTDQTVSSSHPLVLQNPHKVVLGEGLSLPHLKIVSPWVVNTGTQTRIGLLEVLAPRIPPVIQDEKGETDEEQKEEEEDGEQEKRTQPSENAAVFQNLPEASLTLREGFLNGMDWRNDGKIILQKNLDMGQAAVFNNGLFSFQERAKLTNAVSVVNGGLIEGEGTWHLENIGVLINEQTGTLGKKTDSLHLQANTLQNIGIIQPASLEARLNNGGENHGQIKTTQKTTLTSLGDWVNGEESVVESQGTQNLFILGQLTNTGTIKAPRQTLWVQGLTYNAGRLEGGDWTGTFADLWNEGTIGAETALALTIAKGKNTAQIGSQGRFALTLKGLFENDGKIASKEALTLSLQGRLVNKKVVTSKASLETSGDGILENHGTFQGDQETGIGHAETDNYGLMVEKGAVHLNPTRRFHNHTTGLVNAKGALVFSGTAPVTNEAGSDKSIGFGGQDIVFENYGGVLTNQGGRITADRDIKGSLHTLMNKGLMQAGAGYSLTVQEFFNEGLWQGQGQLSLTKGKNRGKLSALLLTVSETLVNDPTGFMGLQSLEGSGSFENTGTVKGEETASHPVRIGVKEFHNNKLFEPGEEIVFTPSVQTWTNGEQGEFKTQRIQFLRRDGVSQNLLNQGVLTARQMSLERSLDNEGLLEATDFSHQAPTLINGSTATLKILGPSTLRLDTFTNQGEAIFQGNVSGSIQTLHNQTALEAPQAGETDTRDRLEFKALNTLTGTSLLNDGLLIASQDLGWQGADVTNTGVLVTRSPTIGFTHQLINKGLWRWQEGDITLGRRHLLNLNTLEKTANLKAPYKALDKASVSKTQTTTFQEGVFENRGQWRGQAQRVIATKLLQTGSVSLEALAFDVTTVLNQGVLQLTQGDLTGRIGSLENTSTIRILRGVFDTRGTSLTNKGEISGHGGIRYTGTSLQNQGQLLTPEKMTLTLRGALKNTGTVQADGGFEWTLKTLDHQRGKIIGHAKHQNSRWAITETLTTAPGTDCQLQGLEGTAETWQHNGTMSLGAASSVRASVFKHKGLLASPETVSALLTLETNVLELQGVLSFYDLSVTAKRATSTAEGKLLAANALTFEADGSYKHYGVLQAKALTYRGRQRFSDFYNYGRVVSTQTTDLHGTFRNQVGGEADLTKLTVHTFSVFKQSLLNSGKMWLRNLQSLGKGTRGREAGEGDHDLVDIINAQNATLIFETCGYSYGCLEEQLGVELEGGGFAFGTVTNHGTIGFGKGTYHIRGTFENNGKHLVLDGQDLWYGDLVNDGEIRASKTYHMDHTRGSVTKIGMVRTKKDLLLDLGDRDDAAEVIASNDIASVEGVVEVKATQFTAPHDLNLPGSWFFNVANFICPFHLKASHLTIWAGYLETGNAQRLGYLESADGVLDIWARKLKNTHGKLWGERGLKIIVEDEDLENGASLYLPGVNPEHHVEHHFGPRSFFRRGWERRSQQPQGIIYGSNGSGMASNGPVTIEVRQGNFYNRYGVIHTPQPLDIWVQGVLSNKAGHIHSGTSGKIAARRLEVTREDQGSSSYVSHYTTHVSKSGWGPWQSRTEWQEAHYATRYWEQSEEALIDITKETQGASGDLELDCPEVFITASSLLASGWIWSVPHRTLIGEGDNLPTGFSVLDRNGKAGKIMGRNGVYARAGSMTITGSGAGQVVRFEATDFLLEGLNIKRREDSPKVFIAFDLVKFIQQRATPQGFIQDRGYTKKGKPRFGFGVPVDPGQAPDKRSLTFLDQRPANPDQTEHAIEPSLVKRLTRELMSHVMGLEGLRDDLIERFQKNIKKTGQEVISLKEMEKLLEAHIVWKLKEVYKTSYEIARLRGEDIDSDEEVDAELHPILGVPAAAQDYRAEGGGALVDSRQGGQGVHVSATQRATFKSGYMEGERFDIQAKTFLAETTKRTVVTRDGDTVTTQELFLPPMTFIGRQEGQVIAQDHYQAIGADFATGEGGGQYRCEHGDKVDKAAVATTTVETTRREKGGRFLGFSTGGGRTTVETSTSQELLRTRYRSLGTLEHHAPEGTHIREGVENTASGEILFNAQNQEARPAVALQTRSVATEKSGVFQSSSHSRHQESASFAPNITRSHTRVRVQGTNATWLGEGIQAPEFLDRLTGTFTLGMAKRELANRASSSRDGALGGSSIETQGGQEVGLPSVLSGVEGINDGKMDWVSEPGKALILSGVIAQSLGQMHVKKDARLETPTLNAWQTTSSSSYGFSAPILDIRRQDSLVPSLREISQEANPADQTAALLKGTSEVLRAGTDGFKILQALNQSDPLSALKTLIGRWTTVSFSLKTGSSSEKQSVAQPNVLNFEALILDNTSSHLEGHLSGKKLVVLSDTLTTAPMVSTRESHAQEQGGGVSVNVLTLFTALPTVNVHQASSHTEQKTHAPTTVTVDQLFIRVNNAVFSGTQIQAKLVDALVSGNLTLESVLDTFRSSQSGFSFSTSGDFRIEDREQVKEKINEVARIVGTQQFYLKVGQTLLTRSADYGLQSDGTVVQTLKTAGGEDFYLRPIPEEDEEEENRSLRLALELTKEEAAQFFVGGDLTAELTPLAQEKNKTIVVWQANPQGVLYPLISVGQASETLNLLKTGEHFDLLEIDPTRVEAGAFQQEVIQERDDDDHMVINMPIGTAFALASQMTEIQQLISQAHTQAKEQGQTDQEAFEVADQVREVSQELRQAEAELAQAEREAKEQLQNRQRLRTQAKREQKVAGSSSGSSEPRDMSHITDLLQADGHDQDILRDLAARQQQIIDRHQAALERRTWLEGAKDIGLAGVEVLKEVGREIRDNPIGFAGAVAYEGFDSVIPGGLDAPAEFFRGQRSFASMVARQGVNIAAEVATGYVAGKALKAGYRGIKIIGRFTGKATAKLEARWAAKQEAEAVLEKIGGAIRENAIPAGSKLEYLAPGRVRYDGVEFRAVRDLGHIETSKLWDIYRSGKAPKDVNGKPLRGHHHQQRYHREDGAFIVEMPATNHKLNNPLQHPYGNTKGAGLTIEQRADWDKLRNSLHKERARTELIKRGVFQ